MLVASAAVTFLELPAERRRRETFSPAPTGAPKAAPLLRGLGWLSAG